MRCAIITTPHRYLIYLSWICKLSTTGYIGNVAANLSKQMRVNVLNIHTTSDQLLLFFKIAIMWEDMTINYKQSLFILLDYAPERKWKLILLYICCDSHYLTEFDYWINAYKRNTPVFEFKLLEPTSARQNRYSKQNNLWRKHGEDNQSIAALNVSKSFYEIKQSKCWRHVPALHV